ncbi:MAG: hypothetical protein R2731_09775 [Nocardioides sp.]
MTGSRAGSAAPTRCGAALTDAAAYAGPAALAASYDRAGTACGRRPARGRGLADGDLLASALLAPHTPATAEVAVGLATSGP